MCVSLFCCCSTYPWDRCENNELAGTCREEGILASGGIFHKWFFKIAIWQRVICLAKRCLQRESQPLFMLVLLHGFIKRWPESIEGHLSHTGSEKWHISLTQAGTELEKRRRNVAWRRTRSRWHTSQPALKWHVFNMLRRGQSDTGSGYKAEQGAICAGTKEETRHLLLLLDNRVNLSCLSREFVLK